MADQIPLDFFFVGQGESVQSQIHSALSGLIP